MRFDDLIKKPAKPQKTLTYTESLQTKLDAEMSSKPTPKFTAVEWAIMEGGGSLEDTKVTELFEPKQAVKIHWNHDSTRAVALIDPKTKLVVNFLGDDDPISIEFSVNDQFDMTGGGNVSPIFATVIEAVKQFTQNNSDCSAIYFTAHEQSRARMYDTLAKRVARQLGWHVVPYDDMVADEKYQTALSYGDFTFAIEKGPAPKSRQDAQKPQHGDFMPVWHVISIEHPELFAVRIKAKNGDDAESWVMKNVPEYKDEDAFGVFARKTVPNDRPIIDKGEVPAPKKPEQQDPNNLGAQLRAKLDAPQNENFADGKNPQDKGDSKRHGVPTKANVSTLRKVAKQGGRKGQLAHWMANMKAGKDKKK
jgi:hypothetical protein